MCNLHLSVAAVVVRARVRCVVGDGECGGCGYVV
ncbi:hypothetical protein Tco_0714727, partial [Tanacetum coccineum]